MTTLEVTTVANQGNESRLLALRVTPEQEIAIYAFFQINGWTIITEEVPKHCLQCQRELKGEDAALHCVLCQRAVNSAGQIQMKDSETQTQTIIQVQDQAGRKVVILGNTGTINAQTPVKQTTPQIILKSNNQQTQNPITQVVHTTESSAQATPQMISLVKQALPQANLTEIQVTEITNAQPAAVQVATPIQVQPKIYNVNNSSENRPYKCDDCGKHFRKKSHVHAHMKFHSGEELPKCEICGKEFLYKHNLLSHASIHSGERPFHCTACPKTFRRKDDLQVHMRTHTGERPYACDICGKRFTTQNQLPKHRRTHTGEKPYECEQCLKCFRTKPHLEKHYRTHSGERPYKCDECGRAFTQNAHLMAHHRIHTGEKPFQCDQCFKCFKESKTLKKHKLIHVRGMPFSCKICGKGFLRSQNLDVHMCVHAEEDPSYRKGIIKKKKVIEPIENGNEQDLETSNGNEDIETSIVEEGEVKMELLEEKGNLTEEGEVEDNKNVSIANSLLSLVEMITNAEQETKDGTGQSSSKVMTATSSSGIAQAGYTVVPSSSFDSETLATVQNIVARHGDGKAENIIITHSEDFISEAQDQNSDIASQDGLPPGMVIVEQETGHLIGQHGSIQPAQMSVQQDATHLQPDMTTVQVDGTGLTAEQGISQQEMDVVQQAVTIIADHEAQQTGLGQQESVVITTNDGVIAEDGSIIQNVDGQFVDGETYVMEVQFVEEN